VIGAVSDAEGDEVEETPVEATEDAADKYFAVAIDP
jgi:hypothetical protein